MILFWGCYVLFCMVHLFFCLTEREKGRKVTKIFIVPLLMLGLILTKTYNMLLFAGLFFGWIGDILLALKGKNRYFITGAVSFAIGHFFYIAAILIPYYRVNAPGSLSPMLYLLLLVILGGLLTVSKVRFEKMIGRITYLGSLYFTVLSATVLFSLFTQQYFLAMAFGVFLASDITIAVCYFFAKVKRDQFYIMVTYILAQTLICINFM